MSARTHPLRVRVLTLIFLFCLFLVRPFLLLLFSFFPSNEHNIYKDEETKEHFVFGDVSDTHDVQIG